MERGRSNFRSFRQGARDFQQPYILKGVEPGTDNGQNYWEDGSGNRVYLADTSGGNVVIVLPSAGRSTGTRYTVKRTTGGVNTLFVYSLAGNIDGTPTYSIGVQYSSLTMFSDGNQYWIV